MQQNNKDSWNKDTQQASGSKEPFTKKLGDKIERAGEKIQEKAPGIGKSVKDFGNKVEHSHDNKKSR